MSESLPGFNLQTIDDLHQVLFDVMADGVLVVDHNGRIIDCNSTFHQRLGYERDELLGLAVTTLDPPEFAARVPERLAQIRSEGQATFETAHYCKDGSLMPVELNARCFEVQGNTVFFSIVRDISERKTLEQELQDGLDIYQAAINTPALGFWAVDMQGRLLEVNEAYVQQSGYGRDELLQMGIPDLEALEKPEETGERIRQIIDEGYGRFRSLHRRKDGSIWPVEVVTTFSQLKGGRFFAFIEDISERVEAEGGLELASQVFETMDQAVVVTDANNRIVTLNPAATRITGYSLEEVRGYDPKVFSSGRQDAAFYDQMWASIQHDGRWEGEIWDRRKDGHAYLKWLTINAICDTHGQVQQYVSVFSDITERKQTEELIWRQANFDSLTGLPNRHLLHERLQREIAKSQRTGHALALLFIDLDRFKEVNDNLGHAKGDQLLIQAAERLSEHLRETDTVARLGGDEFTVLLPEFGQRSALERITLNLLRVLDQPYELGDDDTAYTSASIGITLFPDDADDLESLLKQADQAMYVAKAAGRNRYSYFTASMQEEAREKLAVTNELRKALAAGQLEVYYQPIVDLKDNSIIKAEALLRWSHPHRGMVSPAYFIPLAEEAGLIHEIGEWVLRQVLDQIVQWREELGCNIQVSVNKSPLQFERPAEPSWEQQLIERELPGNSITVEITEGSLLSTSERIHERLLAFRNAGIEVSIDDFGTGFSALSYLHRFDIDYLKIDRSFVMELDEGATNTALVEAIIVMAHKLGIKTIAEGVETEAQREMLRDFGCDYAQGFLYSPPVSAQQFTRQIQSSTD